MMRRVLSFFALLWCVGATSESTQLHGNPIRRVVTMLQEMQKSVEKEGETEKELYDKFMCYCETTDQELAASIDAGSTKVSELESQLEQDTAEKAQMDQDVTQHKADREAAEKTVSESTAMRGKEAAEFAASSGELKANIQAMTGALSALKKGLSAALLQTSVGDMLRNIVQHTPLLGDTQRDLMMSYLQAKDGDSMEGGSDQIVGIIETMLESMQSDLKEATDGENQAVASYDELMKAKGEEISAATKGIETKMARSGTLAVSAANGGADLEDSKESLAEDTTFKATLAKTCTTKTNEFNERSNLRAQEVTAISETIKILNDDDALDLFKKALPSGGASAFLQTRTRSKYQMKKFMDIFNKLTAQDSDHTANYKLMLVQTKSKTGDFEHIAVMIDEMINLLKKEQADDDRQKEFCDTEIGKAGDEKAATEDNLKSIGATISSISEQVETTSSEIATLKQGIEDLDRSVAGATEMRKEEHAEYSSTAAANQAALELLEMAKNRMNKFYNPSMYKAAPTTEAPLYGLLQQESASFVQVSMHSQLRAQEDNLAFGTYSKSQASGGIIQMLDSMMSDVEKDMTAAKHEEEDGQEEYEETMADATAKRATDSKLMVTKDAAKAELNSKLDDAKSDKGDAETLRNGLTTKITDLHSTCDFLLDNYDFRKEARGNEISGLHEGKAVLSGADAGFMQKF